MPESAPYPEPESQKRRSTRIVQAVPMTVSGVDALGRPFQERTSTLIVNCHGCRYQSKHYVLKNMWVNLEVPHNEEGHAPRQVRARVTWIQRPRTVRELFQIGVDLEVPGNIWGIAFPQVDWFPFPENVSSSEIPAPAAISGTLSSSSIWTPIADTSSEPSEPAEDNVHVLPSPGGNEVSLPVARQVARLVTEARQQMQTAVRETASQAIAAETRPLLAALENQLKEAAEKSVEAAVAAYAGRVQQETVERIKIERDRSVEAMRAEWSVELDRRIAESRQQIDSQLEEVERARRADFEKQIESQLYSAIEKLQAELQMLTGALAANAGEVRTAIDELHRSSEEAAAGEVRRWQQWMDQRESEAKAQLANLEDSVKALDERISGATSAAESNWQGLIEARLAAADALWKQTIEASAENAAQQTAERIARDAESFARQAQDQIQERIGLLGGAFSRATSEAENSLDALHASMARETAQGQAVLSQLQESSAQVQARKDELSSIVAASLDELARRGEALLDARSEEMNRRSESAIAGMAERLGPALESAGGETIARLASEIERQLAPRIEAARELAGKLALEQAAQEKALAEHRHLLWQASERAEQESAARAKEILAQIEKEFAESARAASAKWFAELESKATETAHGTFEALFKSAEWYEKKVQTQMQTALEKGLDQAAQSLREKAGEMSGLFATELDHYSRSYVEHSTQQMEEHAREAAQNAGLRMAQAGEQEASNFNLRAGQLTRGQFESLRGKASSVFEEHANRIEAHAAQLRSRLESDAGLLAAEFERALSQQNLHGLEKAKKELALQSDFSKNELRIEGQSIERELRASLQSAGAQAMDDYRQRLENASNSWMLTTVTKLHQQSEGLIGRLAATVEDRLHSTCNTVFAEMGETIRQRLAGLSVSAPASADSVSSPSASESPEKKSPETII